MAGSIMGYFGFCWPSISVMTSPITFQQRRTEMCICCHVCALAALGEKRHIYVCVSNSICVRHGSLMVQFSFSIPKFKSQPNI